MRSRKELVSLNIIEGESKNVDDLTNELNDKISNFDQEHSTLSQNNYYHETTNNINKTNHLFDINFMRSMQGLRSQDKRL